MLCMLDNSVSSGMHSGIIQNTYRKQWCYVMHVTMQLLCVVLANRRINSSQHNTDQTHE
jgi:hypothetical protein